MANVMSQVVVKKDWLPANPWLWLGAGFILAGLSLIWTLAFGDDASERRVILLAAGLLLTGVGVWLRWSDQRTLYFPTLRAPLALGLGLLFACSCLGVTALYVLSFSYWEQIGLKPAGLFMVWITSAPLAFVAARNCLASERDVVDGRDVGVEAGLAFVVAAIVCLTGIFTLDPRDEVSTSWDSIRLFLRVLTSVCLYGSALAVVTPTIRRIVLSLLFMLHFLAIAFATLSAPPSPWIVQHAWLRLFRPYLEFVYLNNAYHFYAPEPGPASYLWFRIIYTTPENIDQGTWLKIPDLDDQGRIKHTVSLEYQRFLSLSESAASNESSPSEMYFDAKDQKMKWRPIYENRMKLQPDQPIVVGQRTTSVFRIPLAPNFNYMQQVSIPSDSSRRLLASCARFVARKYASHPEEPAWKFKSVKIYRVIHTIPTVEWFYTKIPPNDPELYHPYYAGNFDKEGKWIDDNDPYLFWWLPSIRDKQNDPDSGIKDYARLHAGDPNWIRRPKELQWVTPREDELPKMAPKK